MKKIYSCDVFLIQTFFLRRFSFSNNTTREKQNEQNSKFEGVIRVSERQRKTTERKKRHKKYEEIYESL